MAKATADGTEDQAERRNEAVRDESLSGREGQLSVFAQATSLQLSRTLPNQKKLDVT